MRLEGKSGRATGGLYLPVGAQWEWSRHWAGLPVSRRQHKLPTPTPASQGFQWQTREPFTVSKTRLKMRPSYVYSILIKRNHNIDI